MESFDQNQDHNIIVAELNQECSTLATFSITTILNYCKEKILNPYLRLLSLLSLRPLCTTQDFNIFSEMLNFLYVIFSVIFLVTGYVLQYMSCFRRDRGFCYIVSSTNFYPEVSEKFLQDKICYGSTTFSFIIPSSLHFFAYMHSIYVMRSSDDDQLTLLIERVILASSNLSNGFVVRKKLLRTLWIFISICMIWMVITTSSITSMIHQGNIDFKWISLEKYPNLDAPLKILLVLSILWHDIIEAIIISNYCLQAQLLISYLFFLRERLLQYAIEPIKWMRDVEEFKKILNYLNNEVAISASIFTIINISYAFSGILWLLKMDLIDKKNLPNLCTSILIIVLWISISVIPFIQAMRLTSACKMLKEVGQEVRVRPFVHIETPRCELDSILLYTSSLEIHAKLYHNAITGSFLCFCSVFAFIALTVLGMCHYLTF